MNEDLLKEIKSTLPWLIAAALVVGGYYGVKNYRAAQKAAASEALVSAYTVEELEEAASKFSGADSCGAIKLRLAKKYYDAGRYQEAMDLYSQLTGGNAPDGYADIPVVGRAQCLEALGKYAEAVKEYDAFAAAEPGNYLELTAKLGGARALALSGDAKAALKRVEEIKAAVKDDMLATARVEATEDCIKRLPKK